MSEDIRKDLIFIEINDNIDVITFKCKNDELTRFLQEKALFNNKKLLSKVYLCLNIKNDEIAGFITLSNYLLRLADSKEYSIQKVPAALVGRLAVNDKYRGMNLGSDLLSFAFEVCKHVNKRIACRVMVVEIMKDDDVLKYMLKYGFKELHSSKGFHYLGIDILNKD